MKGKNTLAIKATLVNRLRSSLYNKETKSIIKLEDFQKDVKIILFDQMIAMLGNTHSELNNLKAKKRYKNKIRKEREARGYYAEAAVKAKSHEGRVCILNEAIKAQPENRAQFIAEYRQQFVKA